MWLEVGNESAVQTRRDDGGRLVQIPLEGKRVTRLLLPDSMDADEAFRQGLDALRWHLAEGTTPVWVDSDNDDLRRRFAYHYDLDARRGRPDPEEWAPDIETQPPRGLS